MTAISITGNIRQALGDGKWGGAFLDVALNAPFDDGGAVYPIESLRVTDDGGGGVGFKLTAPASGTKRYNVTLSDGTVYACNVDASPTSLGLSEFLVGTTPDTGDTILLTGTVNHPFGGAAWRGGEIKIELVEAFVTAAAVYPRGVWSFLLDENGKINGATGIVLACKATVNVRYTVTLPDGVTYTMDVNGTAASVDLAAIVP